MLKAAYPVLHVSSSRRAEQFYCDVVGFRLEFAMRFDREDPCYMGFARDDAYLHISSFPGDGVSGGSVMIQVDDVDALYVELSSRGAVFDPTPIDQSWGNREMYLNDPDGNSLRFFQPLAER